MKTDWVGEVFAAMRDCGENIAIVYGQLGSALRTEPYWFELQHDKYDGIGGLAALLRRYGRGVVELPELRDDRLTFKRGVRGLAAVLPTMKPTPRQWLQFDRDREASFLPPAERVAWTLLSEEQTRKLTAAAKSMGATVNTYLLFHLDALVAARLTRPGSCRRWMIPVNLRGAVTREVEAAPHMSFLGVALERESIGQLQEHITQLKRSAYHWGSWLLLNAGRVTGAASMRRDIRKRERMNHGWTGIFSNLGTWSVPGAGSWIFGPAISRVHPVGAGCITMNGRMALTVQLHDALGGGLTAASSLLAAWRQACLDEPAHVAFTTLRRARLSA